MTLSSSFWTPRNVIVSAILLRVVLLLYGLVQDAYSPLKYTDIDYFVFTDAARYVAHGQSPYRRETYRYTPLLAWLLLPTAWGGTAWFSFGKVLFGAADILAGWLLYCILRGEDAQATQAKPASARGTSLPTDAALRFAAVWLLNPMPAQISTRGSSEGLLGAMVVGLLWAVLRRRIALAGFLLGLAVHFKIYPFIYVPAIVLHLADTALARAADAPVPKGHSAPEGDQRSPRLFSPAFARALVNRESTTLAAVSLTTFAALSAAMYAAYGHPFLEHTYLYHVARIDHRHNFSPYNTLLYASSAAASTGASAPAPAAASALHLESLAFMPQLLLSAVLLPLALARRDLAGSMLAQTWAFVALNKVCTSQYFLWYLVLLPLYLPRSSLLARPRLGASVLALWVAMQVLWLQQGYELEFLVISTFVPGLWAAGLGFYLVNMGILGVIVQDVGGS